MGNYEQLKQAVSNVIKSNGNQEITGSILQNTLLTIISTFGNNATFAGIATPTTIPGTPDQNVFYLASENGDYVNFGRFTLNDEIAIFRNSNGSWVKISTGIASEKKLLDLEQSKQDLLEFDDTPTLNSQNPVRSNGIRVALDAQKEEVENAKNEALQAIDDNEQEAIANFNSQRVTPEMLSESTLQLIQASGGGTITNLPDDEDLTSVDNGLGINVIKFANRRYDNSNFSGKGKIILRKKVQNDKNILSQDVFTQDNTIYEIRYDFDLNSQRIIIPENSILLFNGGTLNNGIIEGTNSSFINYDDNAIFINITLDGTWKNISYVCVDWFGNSDTAIEQSVRVAKTAKCPIILKENEYIYRDGTGVLNVENVDIYGSGKEKSKLKARIKFSGNQKFSDFTLDGGFSPNANASNVFFNRIIVEGNNKKYSGFEYFDTQTSYIWFINCEFRNCKYGINIADKGDAYETNHLYVINCYFHDNDWMNFQMIERYYTLENIKYGYNHIYLENSIFIGRNDPTFDQQINVSFDGGTILNSSEQNPLDSLPGYIFINNCYFENGYYTFENAGVSNMTITNSTFYRNIDGDRLLSFSGFINKLNNIWKKGKAKINGNKFEVSYNASITKAGVYVQDGESEFYNNKLINSKLCIVGGAGSFVAKQNEFVDATIEMGTNAKLLEENFIYGNVFRYSDNYEGGKNVIVVLYGILNVNSIYHVDNNYIYSKIINMRFFAGIEYLFKKLPGNSYTINNNINCLSGAYISPYNHMSINNEDFINVDNTKIYHASNLNKFIVKYNNIEEQTKDVLIHIEGIKNISYIFIPSSMFSNLEDDNIQIINTLGNITASVDKDNNEVVITRFYGVRNFVISVKTLDFSKIKLLFG